MKLAINGGTPIRCTPFPAHVTIGAEEKEAVSQVLDSGKLSKYLGCWHQQFYGGEQVRALEKEWATHFGTKHAIAVNSCTSGLYCAVGATEIEPGDEIIVSPYTMSASATAALIFNAIPVFADVEPNYFCLDANSTEEKITSKTRAIVVVDIFGQPYDVDRINAIAKKHNLVVIEDCAQAPGAKYNGRFAGTLGHMGIFSFNYHKHIHTGEGGMIVTDDDNLAERCRLIRNHAEAVVEAKDEQNLVNMIGFNFRMPEIEAAIGRCQLKKLDSLLHKRITNVRYIEKGLSSIPAIQNPKTRENCTHVYYGHACQFDKKVAGVERNRFMEAVKAELAHHTLREEEGVQLGCGYVKPLYLMPIFQQRIAYGSKGYPFNLSDVTYNKGLAPICEQLHFEKLFTHEFMLPSMQEKDMDDVIKAFHKVWELRTTL